MGIIFNELCMKGDTFTCLKGRQLLKNIQKNIYNFKIKPEICKRSIVRHLIRYDRISYRMYDRISYRISYKLY